MTTKVTVSASGPNYPARVTKWGNGPDGDTLLEDKMVASGETHEVWVSPEQTIAVTEEFYPNGYPAPEAA